MFGHGAPDSCESIDPLREGFHLQTVPEVLCEVNTSPLEDVLGHTIMILGNVPDQGDVP